MNELSLVLQKEQEIKEKIEAAKKETDLALQGKKLQLEKKLEDVSLSATEAEQLKLAKEKRIQNIEQSFQEKTQKKLSELAKIKKEKLAEAADYLVEKILCLK